MTGTQIRQAYLNFFKQAPRNHAEIPAARIVPENDPTTLFTSSGMQQLVPYLKGESHSMGTRLVDSQPSFRAEDIEEVGDNRHTTFFEMLGNWSLGDYFKKEQLSWFFEFITQTVGLDPNRLYVTVFEGNATVPRDQTSIETWQQLFGSSAPAKFGVEGFDSHTKIYMYPAKKNWWSRAGVPENMPVGEIGGPDSEVFFDFDPENQLRLHQQSPWKDEACHVNCDCGRFMEIGNSVFMQYVKTDQGFEPLPKQNVDFGGGLERIAAAANDNPDVFVTDLLYPLINQVEQVTGKSYKDQHLAMRVIADHLRAAVFMVAQGIEPSNKLQGYVVRRLIRRAAVKLHRLTEGFGNQVALEPLIDVTLDIYDGAFIDKRSVRDQVVEIITTEFKKFGKTISKGTSLIEKTTPEAINGKFAFDLFQTYGFPLEITEELVKEKGITVDHDAFRSEFKKHQDISRAGSQGLFKGGLADHSETIVKYHTTTHLLHAALRQVLGTHVQQMGSNITAERLRFDFKHPEKVSLEELKQIETIVNQKIQEDIPVTKTIEAKDAALASGALAFFRDKYPDQVSVFTIGSFSKELCGGPHVSSTGQIGPVTIKKEEAVAAGVRRIYMILGQR